MWKYLDNCALKKFVSLSLPSLRELSLESNQISSFEGNTFGALNILRMKNNTLEAMNQSLLEAASVDLSHNLIAVMFNITLLFPRVTTLNLEANKITTFGSQKS